MVGNRLQYMAESRGWLSDAQAGFRPMRSCEDQVLRLTQAISDGYQAKPALRTALALLDFSRAYDTVWRDLLWERLILKGVPITFVRWLKGFLRNRRARVSWNGVSGKRRLLREGVPQGSVLSPLLLLFFIDPLVETVPRGVCVFLYAEDVALWSQDSQKEQQSVDWGRRCAMWLTGPMPRN
jgi:hypothetical protein